MNMAVVDARERVQLCQCGVGAHDGRGFLRAGEKVRFDSFKVEFVANGDLPADLQGISIRGMASVVEELPPPILLKMDIEGSENEILACRREWIAKVGYMMIEFHDGAQEKMWLAVLAQEGWRAEKRFDTWHFRR